MLGGKRRPFDRSSAWPWRSFPPGYISAAPASSARCWCGRCCRSCVVEILNSAVEAVVDRGGMERHPLAGMAKDMGSAAVMLSFVLLGTVWFLILSDH